MLNIEDPKKIKPFALFNLGFRPFFLLAGTYGAIAMLIWMAIYLLDLNILPAQLAPMTWHAHEMVFGFSIAVISGFLLTAIKNWTNIQTLHGKGLMGLSLLWITARILPFVGSDSILVWVAIVDILFMLALTMAVFHPIIKTKQWKHFPIVLKIGLMLLSNALFYLGLLEILPPVAIHWGLYSGLYLIVSLIMLMGRRVIPFFIEKGVDEDAEIKNWKWLDISSLFIFLVFVVVEVFFSQAVLSQSLATILFILHGIRLWGWYTKGIWKKPLLWVLYIGYSFIVLGFGLKALSAIVTLSPWISLHAFAAGGIGIITAGMMSRVALGHTGRSVFDPPAILSKIFILLILAAVLRVIFPAIFPALQSWWIGLSQLFWVIGFGLFSFTYFPMLLKPRVDNRFG